MGANGTAMNAPVASQFLLSQPQHHDAQRLREIPYNYTSYSDREIVHRLLGAEAWELLCALRSERRTGRSAYLLFEIIGDIWVVLRNPYLHDDLLENPKRLQQFIQSLEQRLNVIDARREAHVPERDQKVLRLLQSARAAMTNFERDRKSTRLNSSHVAISYAVFCLKKNNI